MTVENIVMMPKMKLNIAMMVELFSCAEYTLIPKR